MKILLWHGYLMSGSGSNIYTFNVARAWRNKGHSVIVMCQDRHAADLPIVDSYGVFSSDNSHYSAVETAHPRAPGTCTVLRPDIGGLLPVYVYDDYEGFVVKRFVDLSDEELDYYVSSNVTAMETVLREFDPDAVITGHEVMGPYIARLACARTGHRYVAKLHGSALEYAVKLQDRYLDYATEGLAAADRVVGGSRYMVQEAARVVPGWADRSGVVNPGVDVDLFQPRPSPPNDEPVVAFVGKLIAAKGVHNLIAALGLTRTAGLRAVIVGYGGDEDALMALDHALSAGDLSEARQVADALPRSEHLRDFLKEPLPPRYLEKKRATTVTYTGRLDHGPLSQVLPTFDLLVVPSIVPEAFGMVAAEAAACGVLPLVPDHSGIAEAGAALEEGLGLPGMLTFDSSDPIKSIALGIDRVLALGPDRLRDLGRRAATMAEELWSWEHVAERLLAAALGSQEAGPG